MEFIPYFIDCITCGTRLKVTDPSLIGQITFCLKCQSMVEVTPPEAGSVATAGQTAPLPRGKVDPSNGFDNLEFVNSPPKSMDPFVGTDPTRHPSQQRPVNAAGHSKQVGSVATGAVPPVVPELPVSSFGGSDSVAPPPQTMQAAETIGFEMPSTPEPAWKKQVTVGLSAFTGVALAIGAWVFWSASQTQNPAAPVAKKISATIFSPRLAAMGDADLTNVAGETNIAEAVTPIAADEPAEKSRPPLPELPEDAPHDLPIAAPSESPQRPEAEAEPPQIATEEPGSTDPLADSPFEFDFDNPLPPELVKPAPQPTLDPPVVGPPPEPNPPAPSAELVQLLTTKVPAVQTPANQPLTLERFANFVSQLLGRRVLIDPLALEAAGITSQAVVYLAGRDVTLDELLRNALARYGLTYRALGDTILFTLTPIEQTQLREVRFRVGDLAENTVGMQRLAELIQETIAPSTWSTTGGPASLTVDGDSLLVDHGFVERYQVLVLCEKLRVARGMPPKSSFEPSRFEVAPRSVRARAALERTVSFEAGEPLPLGTVLRQLAYQSGVDLQIDHLALISQSRSENMEAKLSVVDQPLGQTLDALLEPLDLVYYPLTENRIVITTPYAMERTMLWEVFPVPGELTTVSDVDQWIDQLCREVQQGSWDAGGGPGRVAFERGSRYIVVRQNPAVLAKLAQQLGT